MCHGITVTLYQPTKSQLCPHQDRGDNKWRPCFSWLISHPESAIALSCWHQDLQLIIAAPHEIPSRIVPLLGYFLFPRVCIPHHSPLLQSGIGQICPFFMSTSKWTHGPSHCGKKHHHLTSERALSLTYRIPFSPSHVGREKENDISWHDGCSGMMTRLNQDAWAAWLHQSVTKRTCGLALPLFSVIHHSILIV